MDFPASFPIEAFIALGAGFLAGCMVTALITFRHHARLQREQALLSHRAADLGDQVARQQNEISRLMEEKEAHVAREAELTTRLEEQQRHNEAKLADLEKAREQLKTEFENLANRILEEKSRQFTRLNQERLDEILKPVSSQLRDFRRRIDAIHSSEQKERGSLQAQLQQLQQLNQRLNEEAQNLTRALKGDKKRQGTWGEIVLETVLEKSGLRKGMEYQVQGSFRDAQGKRLRPDVIIHLPEGKDIIIDSKVSLNAYQEYVAADDELAAKAALKRHIDAIRHHIDDLSGKHYEDLEGINSLDFILMFMPIEPAFSAAFQAEPGLFSKAFESRIIVVTPTTLLATLRTIENMWRFERQQENVRHIYDRAARLYDKLCGFLEDFEQIGRQLQSAQKSYDTARRKLQDGRGNLLRQADTLVELGIKTKKKLPATLRQEGEDGN